MTDVLIPVPDEDLADLSDQQQVDLLVDTRALSDLSPEDRDLEQPEQIPLVLNRLVRGAYANTREGAVRLALSQLGVRESPPGSNYVLYSRWYGLIGPWCAMYLSWVVALIGNTSGYRFASTAASVSWARKVGRLKPLADAQPGDILVRLYTTTTGHTGMATARPRNSAITTAEGNTGGNDRDGGECMHRNRSLGWWHYCIDISYSGTTTTPPVDPPKPPPVEVVATAWARSISVKEESVVVGSVRGYWEVTNKGHIFTFGEGVQYYGSPAEDKAPLVADIVGIAAHPSGEGYACVAADGGVFVYGPGARFFGSMGGTPLVQPVVGIGWTPTGLGYWLFARDGGVFAFGDAPFLGSLAQPGVKLAGPIVAGAAMPNGWGYVMLGSDGGTFHFGNSPFLGNHSGQLPTKAVGISVTETGGGYSIATEHGWVYAYGDAQDMQPYKNPVLGSPAVGILTTIKGDRKGGHLAVRDGGMHSFGNPIFYGSAFGMLPK